MDIKKEYRGQGYGKKSYRMILKYIFEHLNINMIYLKVIDINKIASSLYTQVGFIKTGYFKDYMYRHGKYWNYNIMCLTKTRYKKHNK